LARVELTLELLTSERQSPARGDSKGLLPLIRDIVSVGGRDAFRADLERVRAEVLRRREERAAIILSYQLAVADLARLLRLDPALPLCPIEDIRVPVPLPGDEWLCRSLEELVTFALSNRPETLESRALVAASIARVKAAKFRPLLPNLIVTYSAGDLGGGPDLNPPIVRGTTVSTQPGFGSSGHINHFKNSDDLNATIVWRLQNMGFGNRAEVREQKSLHEQAVLQQLQVHDRIATQVIQSREQIDGWWEQVRLSQEALFDEEGRPDGPIFRSMRLNFERIRGAEGRALEVIDSIRGVNDLVEDYGQALTAHERARFRLLVALGLPPESLCHLKPAPGADVLPSRP
jgi:outer membrane protein TolC